MKERQSPTILVQLFAALLFGTVFAFVVSEVTNGYLSEKKTLVALVMLLLVTGVFAFFFKWLQFDYIFLYLFFATSFFNSGVLTIDIGPFGLFPYRLFFMLSFAIFGYKVLKGNLHIYDSKVKGILLFFYFWLGYAVLSLTWAASLMEGVKYLVLLVIGVALITLVHVYFTSVLHYMNLFYIWIVMTILLIVIGLWNHFTKQHLAVSTINSLPEHVQDIPTAVFTNQNDYAAYLSISIFFFVAFYKYSSKQMIKLLNLGFILLSLYLIYLTESRASLLGLGIGVTAYIFLLSNKYLKKVYLITGALGGTVGVILFGEQVASKVIQMFYSQDTANMTSNDIRINLIKNAVDFITNSFGMGVGAGNSQYYLENYAPYFTRNIYKMHNWILEIFANFGVLIITGYIIVFIVLSYHFYRHLKTTWDPTEKMITEALLFSLITFIPASISPSTISNLFFHWTLLAFSVGYLNYIRTQKSLKHARS